MDIQQVAARHAVEAVVIGASAGGVHALLALLSGLPEHFSLPIIAVLHLPQERDSRLADVFQQRLAMTVREAADKETIAPSTLYFAGSGYHLSIETDRTFSLSCEEPVNYSRPSIDVLMESAADAYGTSLAGVLLTGANFDGAAGLARIKQRGGLTAVQDPAEAQVATMPQAAIRKLRPNLILTLDRIRQLLIQLDHNHANT
ncbi:MULTISPECIES: chemotaxis protein CheB [unclassified Polaromonas]|jgi:two-component system chemotaxis response regulator CheB|uniref:chemotaxis protein CheB n=1 Tax=unclassified Polaromonas TaxID=2638319 RepID=UPI000BD43F63|nr:MULTISPECIES: chemotaxis protein CheB [unclassified Polaromonas]OYY37977.1 MAG: chemotaxis protein CheB [Polaromonas sp. 35-63-35]OYZ21158.1 MAG: chemotaxis protein CheB [Polaromonas sp. 16-63-31]OYZ79523.1 MAG: chemotaxis protein CheB [Polaromonas sp. 24-63-21]OZA50670.1 MAG: chemotaxis protein CheB [Polaromonas sp. 17-63-33]OZA89528.1 MAG: chemotaxis protein CheB [Polaromonas sp. 39-63-25]